jgi:hypothetical protein
MIEKPVFDTHGPLAPKRIRSVVSVETIAKSTLQAQKPKTFSQPKAAVVVADCNCGPQKSAPTVIR